MRVRLYRYLAVIFLWRLLITLFGMVTLLGVLDALSNADLLPEGSGIADQLRYMVLRMPILFDRILVFALLLALLLTYTSLIRRNELVAIAGAGVSVFGQVRALIPAVVIATVVSAAFVDQVNPVAKRALENWLGSAAVREDAQDPQTLWLADERWLVEIDGFQGDLLTGVTLFERGENGAITSVTEAQTAAPVAGGWALSDVAQLRLDGQAFALPEVWRTIQTPETLRLLLAEPRDLSMINLYRLSRMTHSGSQPSDAYLLWFLNRLALPLVAIGFLMLTVPLMQQFGRRDSGELSMAVGVAAGFAFMVADGVFKTLAENGAISAIVAIAIPVGSLMLAGFLLSLSRVASG